MAKETQPQPNTNRAKGYSNIKRLQTRVANQQPQGKSKQPASQQELTTSNLNQYLGAYLNSLEGRQLSKQTIEHRDYELNLFFNWAEQRSLTQASSITLAILESYQRWLTRYRKADNQPLRSQTIRQRLSSVQDYFKWLVRHKYLGANPASELILPKKEIRLKEQALSIKQVKLLMAQPNISDLLGIRDRCMLELLYACAMRLSELQRLETLDINYQQGIIHIRQAKGKKDRLVPLGTRALYWLELYRDRVRPKLQLKLAENAYFLTGYGKSFHVNALGHLIRKYLRQAQVEQGGAHLLRHSCATHLLEGGADIRYIQKFLGHSSLETTALYTEMNLEALRQVYQACHPLAQK